MSNCFATVNFDTEFRVPPHSLPSGDVTCRVLKADCVILDRWDRWVTFKIRLLLKITIKSGELIDSFTKEVVIKESAWLDVDTRVKDCEVVAAVCRCVALRGKILCNVTVKVEFFLRPKFPPRPCDCFKKHHRWDDWDDCDREWPVDWDDDGDWKDDDCRPRRIDFKTRRIQPKIIQCQPCSPSRFGPWD